MSVKFKAKWLSYIDDNLLDAFVDNPYECPIVIDKDGVIRFMSRYNVGLYGMAPEEAVGKHITEVNKQSRMHETLITGRPEIGEIYQLGGRQQIMARIPLKDQQGELIGVLGKRIFHRVDTVKSLHRKLELLEGQIKYYRKEVTSLKNSYPINGIIGNSELIKEAKRNALLAAKSDASVLITGDSGTGKEACAFFIHQSSPRAEGPYIRVNCAAIPAELIESELFGYEGGAFTGARPQGKPGKFELAHMGTILLDEIGDMPLNMQAKLLRVLQEYEIERVGGTKTIRSDFRLVTATNRDLKELVREGRFRSDLFYRLNVFPIYVPPLRERKEDIRSLVYHFLNLYGRKMGKSFKVIPKEEMDKLIRYDWMGNVRELENIIERSIILSIPPNFIVPELDSIGSDQNPFLPAHDKSLKDNERSHILRTMQAVGWKVRGSGGAAELLDIHPSTLEFRMKKLGIERPSTTPKSGKHRTKEQSALR